ncbi:hypothetical protein ACIQJX_26505 [Streptomyces griseoviridis]|uniref:hypothetical protein n=1 Tax=Streptomyces griseoviridis TaxID=45398 RepID=UPI0013E38B9C
MEKKWWGFQVHMNKETAAQVVEVEELIADIVDAAVSKLGKVIAFCLKLHALAITAVNTGEWGEVQVAVDRPELAHPHPAQRRVPWPSSSQHVRRAMHRPSRLRWSAFAFRGADAG